MNESKFSPSLSEIRDGVWSASMRLPVVGDVSVTANSLADIIEPEVPENGTPVSEVKTKEGN